MQTFKLQVEDLIGRTLSDTSGLNDMLTATACEVADRLPKDVLIRNATVTQVTSNPTSIHDKRILSISRNGYYANEKPFSASGPLSDSGSIYYADAVNKKDPVFYFKGKDLIILPAPGSGEEGEILSYTYPTVAHGDSAISDFPNAAEYAVTLGAAAKFMMKLAAEDQNNEDIELATNTASFAQQLKIEYEKELQRIVEQK